MTIKPRRLGHLGIVANDLDAFVAFYEDMLGFIVSDRMPYAEDSPFYEGVWMRCNSDHHAISVFGLRTPDVVSGDPRRPRRGLHHMAFELASQEDLKRAAIMARERNIPIQGMRTGGPGVQLRLYIWDPENNLVELYWGLDQVGWDGVTRPFPPVETIDLETFNVNEWLQEKGPEFSPRSRLRVGNSR